MEVLEVAKLLIVQTTNGEPRGIREINVELDEHQYVEQHQARLDHVRPRSTKRETLNALVHQQLKQQPGTFYNNGDIGTVDLPHE